MKKVFLAAFCSNHHHECHYAIGSLFEMFGHGQRVFYFVVMVFPMASSGTSLVHGALLVFLFLDSDKTDYANAAREDFDIYDSLCDHFYWCNLMASNRN